MTFTSTLWIVAGVLFVIVAICIAEKLRTNSLRHKWPPIDDDEFMQRCSPGTRRETALTVRRIVSEQLGVPYEHVYPEQRFVEDLDCG